MGPMDLKTHELNSKIVANVKKHRVLYDNTVPEYSIKRYSKGAWEAIARECGLSEKEVKFRWRNLRISYLRYNRVKRNSTGHVKPYYLQEDMAFMLPFISSRPSNPNAVKKESPEAQSTPNPKTRAKKLKVKGEVIEEPKEYCTEEENQDIEFEYVDENDEKHQLILGTSSKPDSPISIIQPENTGHEVQEDVQQTEPEKQNYYEIVSTSRRDAEDNADWSFLKSFLPDLQKMTPGQKIKFKLALCTAINDILYA